MKHHFQISAFFITIFFCKILLINFTLKFLHTLQKYKKIKYIILWSNFLRKYIQINIVFKNNNTNMQMESFCITNVLYN